ncbi:MAG: HAMP domain-containing protein [Chloroflexi bacterium]|nr:HAMP domain-containing protein [Chloroflexota bacterium]
MWTRPREGINWLPRNLQARLLLTYVTLMLLGVGSLIAWTGERLAVQTIEQAEHDLELHAQIIANALREPLDYSDEERGLGRSLAALIGSYAQNIGGRVTVVDTQLKLVETSDARVPVHVEDDHPEFVAARAGSEQHNIRWDEWVQEERLFVAAPVLGERGQPMGYVQLSISMLPLYAAMAQTWMTIIGVGLVVLVITVFASIVLARHIAVPVEWLTATSEQIAAGHLERRVVPAGPNEIRRLGLAFNRMAERVQDMLAQQREFVDNAAHELRSPLTSIRLRIEMLQEHGENNHELTRRYLGQMGREVDYLQRLVDHLLTLASVEGHAPALQSLDLSGVLFATADEVELVAQQSGLAFHADLPDHLPRVRANPEQISIVVRNLLDNACKYTHRGGAVALSARAIGTSVEICVTDTGMGIPGAALPRIFERFYRVDPARSRVSAQPSGGGAGLGLSLVRAIVERHGGRIDVQSREGQGSAFIVRLPIESV